MTKPTTVADIMTRNPDTISPRETLEFMEAGMERFRFRHLPVEEDGQLVGVLTHRDVLRTAASSLQKGGAKETKSLQRKHTVGEVMTRDVKAVKPDAPLADAARLLEDQKIGCLPVVDDGGGVVGIVTEADFVRLARQLLDG